MGSGQLATKFMFPRLSATFSIKHYALFILDTSFESTDDFAGDPTSTVVELSDDDADDDSTNEELGNASDSDQAGHNQLMSTIDESTPHSTTVNGTASRAATRWVPGCLYGYLPMDFCIKTTERM